MRVSIIIPTFNRAGLICHSIDSILAQTCGDYEIIVVDDGSTDDTTEVLEKYDGRIRCIRQENRGFGAARNRGLEEARGEYVAFLDSDDLWKEYKLGLQVEIMDRLPEIDFLFSDFTILKPSGDLFPKGLRTWHGSHLSWDEIYQMKISSSSLGLRCSAGSYFDLYLGDIYAPLLDEPLVLPSSAIVRRSSLAPDILFTVGDPLYADWDFFARLARSGTACFLDVDTTINRGHHDDVRLTTNCSSLTRAQLRLALIERVWKSDADFAPGNKARIERIEAEQLAEIVKELLLQGRTAEAKAAIARCDSLASCGQMKKRLTLLKVIAGTPGGTNALLALYNLRRVLIGRG